MTSNTQTYSSSIQGKFSANFINPPATVGWWCVTPGVKIAVYKLPSKFHQWTMRLFFGWTFELYNTQTTTKQMLHG